MKKAYRFRELVVQESCFGIITSKYRSIVLVVQNKLQNLTQI